MLLALVIGGYMLVDLGPWGVLVRGIGIDPRSYTMNDIFIFFGICWIGAMAFYLFGGAILSMLLVATSMRPRRTSWLHSPLRNV